MDTKNTYSWFLNMKISTLSNKSNHPLHNTHFYTLKSAQIHSKFTNLAEIFQLISALFCIASFFYRLVFGIAIFFINSRHFRHLLDPQHHNQPEHHRSQLAWTYIATSIGFFVLTGLFLYFLSVLIRGFQCVEHLGRRHKQFWLVKRQGTVVGYMV